MFKSKKLKLMLLLVCMLALQWALTSCVDKPDHTYLQCKEHVTSVNISDSSDLGSPGKDLALLDFEDSMTHQEVLDFAQEAGIRVEEHSSESVIDKNLYVTTVTEGSVPLLAAHLKGHHPSQVQSVSEDHVIHALRWTPDDPLIQFQWHLDQIGTQEAWTLSTGKGSVVAVLDTGVSLEDTDTAKSVQDLKTVQWVRGWDFVRKNDRAVDIQGHGTHVAGTIAQNTNNGYGGAGVAYGATLMPVRVLGDEGSGAASDVIAGIYFAADNGAHVMNMSLGSSHPMGSMQDAVTYAHMKGTTVIAAAGNSGRRAPGYPAAYDHVISVSATQYDLHPAPYSQWGPKVDIAAPGGNTKHDLNKDGKPDGVLQETIKSGKPSEHFFGMFQGTSMAAPHVAGTVALINQWGVTHPSAVEKYLGKGADQSRLAGNRSEEGSILKKDHYPQKEFRERYGVGIVQADSAVTAAILEPGVLRFMLTLFLGCVLFVLSRQQNLLEADIKVLSTFMISAACVASGFFVLPFVMPYMEAPAVASITQVLSTPLMGLDWVLTGHSQNPLLACFLWPMLMVFGTQHSSKVKYFGAGFAVGCCAYLLGEMILLTSPLMWIPGGDVGARVYYAINAGLGIAAVYFSLRVDTTEDIKEDNNDDA